MEFTLTITLGNAAMETPHDVAGALTAAAQRIYENERLDGSIRDENGNTVGSYAAHNKAGE